MNVPPVATYQAQLNEVSPPAPEFDGKVDASDAQAKFVTKVKPLNTAKIMNAQYLILDNIVILLIYLYTG